MSLETTLTDIIARLRQGRFPNEQAVSQGIVLRALQQRAQEDNHQNRRRSCPAEPRQRYYCGGLEYAEEGYNRELPLMLEHVF
jgi:hypothetical protein